MKLDIYGGPKHGGWSAHGEWEGKETDAYISPCPFCQSEDVECTNTHTPFYTVNCNDCGAEGPRRYDVGRWWNRRTSRKETERIHRQAFKQAIEAWNESERY